MAGMDAATRVVAARDQVSVEVDGEAVILNLADGVYYGLDPVGARVWGLMEEPRTVAELRDAVVAEWEVDAPTAEADLLELLADLAARGLVEVRPAE
ncbi:MAG TPA: PqqD family protein [Longimicrobium sp.]|nr:PqqD family protein [Longimicrobium sp.]